MIGTVDNLQLVNVINSRRIGGYGGKGKSNKM